MIANTMKKNIDRTITFNMLRKDYINASNDNLRPSKCSISLNGLKILRTLIIFQESKDLLFNIKDNN